MHVVDRAAIRAGAAAGDAARDLAVVDLEQQHRIERLADVLEHALERQGLRARARKAVEHEAVRGVGLRAAARG